MDDHVRFWPESHPIRRWLTGVTLCLGAGALTFHLAEWFGVDDPAALAVMVVLAQLFLGACVFLGLLITTRISESMMQDPVHDVAPAPAPAVWSQRSGAPSAPEDKRLQQYLQRVLGECRRPGVVRESADGKPRRLGDRPVGLRS